MSTSTTAMTENATRERYLTFMCDGLVLGMSTNYVIEIIANYMIRPLPRVPGYIQGVINLRGQVLPVIDMRLRMNKEFLPYTSTTCVVILEVNGTMIGLAVDTVLQVQDIDVSHASQVPIESHRDLTSGMISLEDGTVVLLVDCAAVVAVN